MFGLYFALLQSTYKSAENTQEVGRNTRPLALTLLCALAATYVLYLQVNALSD